MKKIGLLLLLLVVAIVATMATTQPAYAGGPWGWNQYDAGIARHNAMHGRQNSWYSNGYPNEYYGYGCSGYPYYCPPPPPRIIIELPPIHLGGRHGGITIGGRN